VLDARRLMAYGKTNAQKTINANAGHCVIDLVYKSMRISVLGLRQILR
jgi:hypothetical protein